MEFRQLRYFIAVAEELHFNHAAKRLNMAQPPLSQQIKKLEDELGVKLFERTKRSVQLTAAGKAFLGQARRVLAGADFAKEVARQVGRGERGTIDLGVIYSAVYTLVPRVLRAFGQEIPGMQVNVQEMTISQQIAALLDGKIQIGVLRPPIQSADLRLRPVLSEDLVAILPVGHPLEAKSSVTLAELAENPFITFSNELQYNFRHLILDHYHAMGIQLNVSRQVAEMHTLIGFVGGGLGVSLVPASLQSIHISDVVYRPVSDRTPKVSVSLAWHKDFETPMMQRYLDLIESCYSSPANGAKIHEQSA